MSLQGGAYAVGDSCTADGEQQAAMQDLEYVEDLMTSYVENWKKGE